MTGSNATAQDTPTDFDVVIVGAGFGGLYAIYRLRQLGFSVRAFEAGSGVGGTWFWNRYPGARCDVESMQYSYSFSDELQQDWNWTERFASQPEILSYVDHVAERFDLLRDVQLDTTIRSADWDELAQRWTLTTAAGEQVTGRFCIMATGCLSVPRISPLPGQEKFAGEVYYTAQWPKEGVDVTGLRVGVVGTGASGTQSIPHLAKQAEHLFVFQRTANFSVPSWNASMTDADRHRWKSNYAALRKQQAATKSGMIYESNPVSALSVPDAEREAVFEKFWKLGGLNFMQSFADLNFNRDANATASNFVMRKIKSSVRDEATATALLPSDHAIGMRRICTDYGYYDTFNRDNVTLVDVRRHPITEVTETGIRTSDGDYAIDALVMATGFEAMTGALFKIDIRGRDGVLLRDKWVDGPLTYLGLAVSGFPNLFTQTGPHSPSTMVSLILGNEQHVNWIADCLVHMRDHGLLQVEAEPAAELDWVEQSQEAARPNLKFEAPASSYIYVGPSGKRMFMVYLGGFDRYSKICDEIAEDGYRGFAFRDADGDVKASRMASLTIG